MRRINCMRYMFEKLKLLLRHFCVYCVRRNSKTFNILIKQHCFGSALVERIFIGN